MNQFTFGERQHDIYGNYTDVEFEEDDNQASMFFLGESLEEVNRQIREELKAPMFYLSYLPDDFSVEEAIYEKTYRIINIKLVDENGEHIYIFQQKQIDDTASGIVKEGAKASIVVSNEKLNNQISIYEAIHDNGWLLEVKVNNDLLTIDTSISKEECIKIAENIEYK